MRFYDPNTRSRTGAREMTWTKRLVYTVAGAALSMAAQPAGATVIYSYVTDASSFEAPPGISLRNVGGCEHLLTGDADRRQ